MREIILRLLMIVLLLAGILQQGQAQDKMPDFNLNIGGLINASFEPPLFWFSLGAGLDFHLEKHILISPETQLWVYDFETFLLNAGAILNFKLKNFFEGGGAVFPIFVLCRWREGRRTFIPENQCWS